MAKNGKMVILRGTSDPDGKNKLLDEFGKPAKWPIGALHVRAAEDFARKRGYEPKTLAWRVSRADTRVSKFESF